MFIARAIALLFPALLICSSFVIAADEVIKSIGKIERIEPAFDELVPEDAKIEVLAEGFAWSEGPVWVPNMEALLFSDIPNNRIVRWKPGMGTDVFMQPSGYTGHQDFPGKEPGTNGLGISPEGHLTMCCHGDRMICQIVDGQREVLIDRYKGKRLNSPNDLVYHSNGDLYFTDPPYGLPKQLQSAEAELDYCGVYRLRKGGKLQLLTKEMTRPNGIAFSPDEQTLYVAQSDSKAMIWKAFPVEKDGSIGEGKIFFDATKWAGELKGAPDGLKVDTKGNLWATGPGGVLVFNPQGKMLGRINTGERTANCVFGPDGTLYMTADRYLCRVRTNARGVLLGDD